MYPPSELRRRCEDSLAWSQSRRRESATRVERRREMACRIAVALFLVACMALYFVALLWALGVVSRP